MKIALVDDDPRALAQLEQYLTEQLGREHPGAFWQHGIQPGSDATASAGTGL